MLLRDRVAIVSGIGPGLGRDASLALAREGASLALAARTPAKLEGVAKEVEALGARVIRGRALGPSDTQTSEPVIAINETLAKRYFPGEDPVNRLVAWGGAANHGPWMRVVGVIADIKQAGLAKATEPQTWQPWAQV